MTDTPPDRLSIYPDSPFYDYDVLARGIGVPEASQRATALLEAVSMLAPGRGLRRAALGELAQRRGGIGFQPRQQAFPGAHGGFHLTLAQAGRPGIVSVEFNDALVSVQAVERPAVHANHMVHAAMAHRPQIVTGSSGHRQLRGDELLRQRGAGPVDPLDILFDAEDPRYPIYRDRADDSDHENTLATASFTLGPTQVDWVVRTGGRRETSFRMRDALRL